MNGDLLLSKLFCHLEPFSAGTLYYQEVFPLMEPGNHNLILLNHFILIIVFSPERKYICPAKFSFMMENVSALSENVFQIIS